MVKRVLITAPEAYQPRFAEAFRQYNSQGINPVFMPFISTVPMLDSAELGTFVSEYQSYDYVICSSRMAVSVLAKSGIRFMPDDERIIAIGKDQDAVRSMLRIQPALHDAEPSMMGIVEALRCVDGVSSKKIAVLLPTFEGLPVPSTITNFMATLADLNTSITPVHCYRTSALAEDDYSAVLDTLTRERTDAIALTSGGEAYVLACLLRYAKSHGMDINISVYSFGPYTTKCAYEAGLTISATSPHFHSFDDYVQFLVEQV